MGFRRGHPRAGRSSPARARRTPRCGRRSRRLGRLVRATGVIGQRVHPRTGVLIVYVPAASAGRVDAVAAGPELSAVRWVGLAKAGEPMATLAGTRGITLGGPLVPEVLWRAAAQRGTGNADEEGCYR
jgi:hypothetical protein